MRHAHRLVSRIAPWLTAVAVLAGCGGRGVPHAATAAALGGVKAASFKAGFMWGVATAGFQCEGGDTSSNWAAWSATGHVAQPIGKAVDHWGRYDEDAGLAADLGVNTYRMSIEWARIEPKRGQFDAAAIQHYHDELSALHRRGIEPLVTIGHWAYPAWEDEPDSEGLSGWESERMVGDFAAHSQWMAKEFGSQVRWWLTLNEPNTFGLVGYLVGVFPPGKHNPLAYKRVMDHQVAAHRLAYQAIHAVEPNAMVSVNPILMHHRTSSDPGMSAQAVLLDDYSFFDAVAPRADVPSKTQRTVDFIAYNYFYSMYYWQVPGTSVQDHWPVYPVGLYETAKTMYGRYGLPILIAENGMCTSADNPRPDGWTREAYIVNHVYQLSRAAAEGVPVLGYVHWSLMDNYEWGSFAPKFGLYGIDQRDPQQTRFKTGAADVYASITHGNGVPQDLAARYLGKTN